MTTKNHLNNFEKLDTKIIEDNSKTADELLLVEQLDADNTEYLAGLLFELARYEESIREYEKLLEMKWDNADETFQRIAMNHYYMEDYEKSLEYLNRSLRRNPDNETTLSYMMLSHESLNDIRSAILAGEHILEINPKNTAAINRLIEYHYQLGNYEKCLHYMNRTEYRDKYKKALMLYRIGKYHECIEEATKIKTAEAYHLAGKAYLEMNNTVKAVKYLYKSYQKDYNTDTLFEISDIYFEAGDSQRSIHYLREVLTHDESNTDAIVKIAEAYRDSAKWHDAMDYARKALEISVNVPEAYIVLAGAYFQLHDLEKMNRILDEGLVENPDSARLWMEKGGYNYPMDMMAFHESFKRAIELKPDDCEILLKYIYLLMMDDETERAKQYYNQVVRVNPLYEKSFWELYDEWFNI